MKVDSHVHVWDPAVPPHADHPLPPIEGTPEDLISNMTSAGVEKSVIVQPINYKFDHSFVTTAILKYPKRLFGVALADTTLPPEDACSTLEKLVSEHNFRGIRINPNFTSGFRHATVEALMQKAGQINVPVALFAQPQHLADVDALLSLYPSTTVLLDHFGFASTDQDKEKVAQMGSRHSQLFVKTSAWFRLSQEAWPHRDLSPYIHTLLHTFGPERMVFGSDYPFVKDQYNYHRAWKVLDEIEISDEHKSWVQGGTATRLYNL